MSFPHHDRAWVEVAKFIKKHIRTQDIVLSPGEFEEYFPNQIWQYETQFRDERQLKWVVVHRGRMETIDIRFLNQVDAEFSPVFANSVFIVFAKERWLRPIRYNAREFKHYRTIKASICNAALEPSGGYLHEQQDVLAQILDRINHLENQIERLTSRQVDAVNVSGGLALTKTIWNHKIYVNSQDLSLTPHILIDGYWEPWLTNVLSDLIQAGMTVVDIGANIGYYTLLAASKVGSSGKVIAFEASPDIYDILWKNINVNGLMEQVSLVNKAAFSETKKLRFGQVKNLQGSSSVVNFPDSLLERYRDEVTYIEVEAISLDEYFANHPTSIDVIKIDAEGSEPYIFQGMKQILKNNPTISIVFEFSLWHIKSTGLDPRLMLEELLSYGFNLRVIEHSAELVDASIDDLIRRGHCEVLMSR
jgi:FkbM family methyltransferase